MDNLVVPTTIIRYVNLDFEPGKIDFRKRQGKGGGRTRGKGVVRRRWKGNA